MTEVGPDSSLSECAARLSCRPYSDNNKFAIVFSAVRNISDLGYGSYKSVVRCFCIFDETSDHFDVNPGNS